MKKKWEKRGEKKKKGRKWEQRWLEPTAGFGP